MKNLINKRNIAVAIVLLIILLGIISLICFKFNKSIDYLEGTRIEAYIAKGYNRKEVINIAKECFPNSKISFKEIEKLNQVFGIKLNTYTKEELKNFKNKIIEQYNIKDEEALQLQEISIPATKLNTIVKPYVLPTGLILILSLIYITIINFRKKDKLKIILNLLLKIFFVIAVYFSIILIGRIPFNMYTMPIALLIYFVTLLISIKKKN